MSYLIDLAAYLGQPKQTLNGLVASMRPAVDELNTDLTQLPRVALRTVSFDDVNAQVMTFSPGAVVLDAKVYVNTSFDAGTTNKITVATGSSIIPGGGSLVEFAHAYDVSQHGGVPVTGYTEIGFDTDPFLPALISGNQAVYIAYGGTGTAATQGQASVWITYLPPPGGSS